MKTQAFKHVQSDHVQETCALNVFNIFTLQAKYRPVDLLEKEPLKVHLYTLLRCSAITVEQKVPN